MEDNPVTYVLGRFFYAGICYLKSLNHLNPPIIFLTNGPQAINKISNDKKTITFSKGIILYKK
ncbi:hypothetical protein DAT1711_06630 [Enterococcus cecorum]